MKSEQRLLLGLLLLGYLVSPALTAPMSDKRTFRMGIPGRCDGAVREIVEQGVLKLLYGANPGDTIRIDDADRLVEVTSFPVPEATSDRAKLRKVRRELSVLNEFLDEASKEGSDDRLNLIKLPEYLAMAASSRGEGELRILVFGSVFYRSKNPAFSFEGGLFPSDAHATVAKPSESVFSCVGREEMLVGCAVDFCYLTEQAFDGPLERNALRRWWSVWVGQMSGVLTSASASVPDVVESALSGNKRPAEPSAVIDREDLVIEMRMVGAAPVVPIRITEAQQLFEEVARNIPMPEDGQVAIAAVWGSQEGTADVDVWLRAHPGVDEIYFRNKKTPEGELLRDIQHANPDPDGSNWRSSWEVVEVERSVLRDTACWLNLYRSSAPHVEGLVRIAYADRTIDVPFSFSGKGDQGAGRKRREGNSHWVKVDILAAIEASLSRAGQ